MYLYRVIIFYSRTTTHSENNTSTVQTVLTPNLLTKLVTDIVKHATDNRSTPILATLKRTNSVSVKSREFQNIFDKTSSNNSTSDVNSNITGISTVLFLIFLNNWLIS